MMRQGATPTAEQRALFLAHLAQTANVTASAAAADVNRKTAYNWRDDDPVFAAAWDEALEAATDTLEQAARNRAIEGVVKYVTCKDGLVFGPDGEPVTERVFSDPLTALLLRAHRPDKFRERSSVEVSLGAGLAAAIEEGRKRARGDGQT